MGADPCLGGQNCTPKHSASCIVRIIREMPWAFLCGSFCVRNRTIGLSLYVLAHSASHVSALPLGGVVLSLLPGSEWCRPRGDRACAVLKPPRVCINAAASSARRGMPVMRMLPPP